MKLNETGKKNQLPYIVATKVQFNQQGPGSFIIGLNILALLEFYASELLEKKIQLKHVRIDSIIRDTFTRALSTVKPETNVKI